MADYVMTLEDAAFYLICSSMDMGDSLRDEAEYLADKAGIAYDTNLDTDEEILKSALDKLVAMRSSELCEYLKYYFTDEFSVDNIFDDIVRSKGHLYDSDTYLAVKTIYADIGGIPGGHVIQDAIQTNILEPLGTYNIDAARVGSQIGHLYWQYVTAPEFGGVTNGGSVTGCREDDTSDGYVYQFYRSISNYYFRDNYPGKVIPWEVGFVCRFRESGREVIADIFNWAKLETYDEITVDIPAYSITISEFDDENIDTVSQEIGDWFNTHVNDAIEFGIAAYNP